MFTPEIVLVALSIPGAMSAAPHARQLPVEKAYFKLRDSNLLH